MLNKKFEKNKFYIMSTDHTKEIFYQYGNLYYDRVNESFICVPDSLYLEFQDIIQENEGQYIKIINV